MAQKGGRKVIRCEKDSCHTWGRSPAHIVKNGQGLCPRCSGAKAFNGYQFRHAKGDVYVTAAEVPGDDTSKTAECRRRWRCDR